MITRSAFQEERDLLEEPLGRGLVLQEQMILALKGNEPSARNRCRERPAGLEWDDGIPAHVHHERGHGYSGKKVAHVEIAHDFPVAKGAFG